MNQAITHPTAVVALVKDAGLDERRGQVILDTFGPKFVTAEELIRLAGKIVVTNEHQAGPIAEAGQIATGLKIIRCEVEHVRVDLKADSLRLGNGIDNVARMIRLRIEPAEEKMKAASEFAERAAAKRAEELALKRATLLEPFGTDISFYNLGTMDEERFTRLLDAERREFVAREEERKSTSEREAQARAEREAEAATLREENERLKAAQQTLQAFADAEKARADAVNEMLKKEQAEERAGWSRKKAEDDAAKRAEQEKAARAEREAQRARRAAEAAPDAEKLRTLASGLRTLPIPEMSTPNGLRAMKEIKDDLGALADYIDSLAGALAG